MTTGYGRAMQHFLSALGGRSIEELARRLRPRTGPQPTHVPGGAVISADALARRWAMVPGGDAARAELLDAHSQERMALFHRNIENVVGTVKLPVGIAGPLRVNGGHAQGDYYLPLATTEATLVASYSRGSMLATAAGGVTAMVVNEGVSRSPAFSFANFEELGRFLSWLLAHEEDVRGAAEATTRHGKMNDFQVMVDGNYLYLILTFTTGDAAGQNMATIATDAALAWILQSTPIKPRHAFIEANFSGDKKASAQSLQGVRGKKVTAEVTLPAKLVEQTLHATVDQITAYGRMATNGSILSGTLGNQGHYANGLAALFIACGQDAACVAEAAVGTTRMEATPSGDLYVSVTLPNLIVGTVGGGTGLPSQRACLDILGLAGPGHARAFAEVTAGLCLAGEISIVGAICAGEFSRAHAKFARAQKP